MVSGEHRLSAQKVSTWPRKNGRRRGSGEANTACTFGDTVGRLPLVTAENNKVANGTFLVISALTSRLLFDSVIIFP